MIKNWMKFGALALAAWFAFGYVFLVLIKLLLAGSIEKFFWHWDAPYFMLAHFVIGALLITLIARLTNLFSENHAPTGRGFLLLVSAIPFVTLINLFIQIVVVEKWYFGKTHQNYDWVVVFLIHLISQTVVCFSCISYFYVAALMKSKERVSAFEKAQSEMHLKILQQKVDPHFLFNNLNVLSSLIEKNPRVASEFLDKLAQLYRYILHTQNADVVSIKEELDFAENYLYLLRQRFGAAYNFDWQISKSEINGQMIVPTALQSLLENVVKHNAGSRENPLPVCVKFDAEYLIVENEQRPKSPNAAPSGTGLRNLRARYALLTENPFEILISEKSFAVKIPLLRVTK